MENFSNSSLFYSVMRSYSSFLFKRWFSTIEVNGDVRIPENEAVIFAPNHQNAMMDAMALIYTAPAPITFWVRADTFKNKWVTKLLRALKMMPAYRMRNGFNNLKKNEESFQESMSVLTNKQYLCLMPEGGQEEERRLRPLVKGIFRNAFAAQELMTENEWVKIVPVGIDYGNYDKSGRHLIINFGKPISIKDYNEEYKTNPATAMNRIKDDLHAKIKELMLDIQSKTFYSTFYAASYIYNYPMLEIMHLADNATNRLIARQKIVGILETAEKANEPLLADLDRECNIWNKQYKETDLCAQCQEWDGWDTNLISQLLYLIITLPLLLYSLVFNFIPFGICKWAGKKKRNSGFEASVKFGTAAVIFPIVYLIAFLLFAIFQSPDTMTSFVFALSLPISFMFFLRYRWKFAYVKERLRNIIKKPVVGDKIISIMQQIVSKYNQ